MGWVKAKVVCRGEGVLKVSPPLPPPPPKILIVHLTSVEMKINLSDETLVQQNYNSDPRSLYPEIKTYIKDLLNRGWTVKSKSNYSSPVAAVRKRDGGLHLCCDFRKLNKVTIPDRHPLPQIQTTL